MNPDSKTPHANGALAARLILLAVSILVALLAIEGAVRVRQYMKYGTTAVVLNAYVYDPKSDLWVPGPQMNRKQIQLDSGGFRNPELENPKPENRIRLAFLGASTTFCAEVSSNETTWPHLVARELSKRYRGVTFDYVNAGVPGYVVERSLRNLRLRVAPLQPDFILYYEAANDFAKDSRERRVLQREMGPASRGTRARFERLLPDREEFQDPRARAAPEGSRNAPLQSGFALGRL